MCMLEKDQILLQYRSEAHKVKGSGPSKMALATITEKKPSNDVIIDKCYTKSTWCTNIGVWISTLILVIIDWATMSGTHICQAHKCAPDCGFILLLSTVSQVEVIMILVPQCGHWCQCYCKHCTQCVLLTMYNQLIFDIKLITVA